MRYTWLTPPAPAAIALLRCPALARLLDRPLPSVGRARLARLIGGDGQVADEVVALRLAEDVLELCAHGGTGVRAAVDACLVAHGFSPAPLAQDRWSRLAAAPSPAAVAWLFAHPDGEAPPFAAHLLERPPVVLITGPANAGKSTLLNAWCGHDRALVSELPGTTRDLVAGETLIGGWRVRLLDSAGLREGADALERAGQELVAAARGRADLVILLVPADEPAAQALAHPGDLVVAAKADLAAAPPSAPCWSARGLGDRSPARLLGELGAVVLARLGLG